MPSTTLYLVRHGEAEHDDGPDPKLTTLGRRQAASAGTRLRSVGAEALLHSPRRRAVETASIIGQSLPDVPFSSSDLVEDRTPIPADWSQVPDRYHSFLRRVPAAEADVAGRRLDDAVEELSRIGACDRTLVIVTHNFVVGWIVRHVLDAPWWRWIGLNQENGAISTVRWDDDRPAQLIGFNERGHLPT